MEPEAAEKRAILLMRHHGFQAYAAAQYRAMDEQRDVMPYWKYLTMGDERVRESHAALHGLILPANDPFWQTHFPPWDWGCRCQVIPVLESEYREAVAGGRVAGKMNPTYENKTQGWTLGEQGMKALHDKGILDDGSGLPVGVDSPAQKALKTEGPEAAKAAYQWHPGDLDIGLDQLRSRYDAETFAGFEAQAKTTELGDGRTLWDWLNGVAEPAMAEVPVGALAEVENAAKVFAEAASYARLPLAMAKDFNGELSRLSSRYTVGKLKKILTYIDRNNGVLATTVSGRIIKININRMKYGIFSASGFRPIRGEFSREFAGVTRKGLPIRAVAAHEFAHVLYRAVERTAIPASFQQFERVLTETFLRARLSGDIYRISKYARGKPTEFFAECFVMREAGEKLPAIAEKMMSDFFKVGGLT